MSTFHTQVGLFCLYLQHYVVGESPEFLLLEVAFRQLLALFCAVSLRVT